MAVLPKGTSIVAVGGIGDRAAMETFQRVGASGFGLGSALYKAGRSTEEVAALAAQFVGHIREMRDTGAKI
jgi:2-dehydro-3-deoxyphosphogalactonate aldolase|eukprot:SAG25_NODE_167_length_13063_cov_9.799830_8_plen_71_part_00